MNDGLDIPAFLARPRETPEQAEARRRKFARTLGPERKIKAPGDGSKKEWLPEHLSPEAKAILRDERKRKEDATVARIKALKERVRR